MNNYTSTAYFVTEHLPNMVTAPPSEAVVAYQEFHSQVESVMGDTSVPGESDFEWNVLAEIIDSASGDDGKARRAVADAAGGVMIQAEVYERGSHYDRIALHTGPGTFLTVNSAGVPLAFGHELNPAVPVEYDCIDGAAFDKLAMAVLAEKLTRQGADRGAGYETVKEINKALGIIGPTGEQTIGMATLHEIPYTTETAGTDRHALAYSGTTGRTASRLLLSYLSDKPAFVARMGQVKNRVDQLAGLLDTLSSTVANQAAVHGITATTRLVTLPNPIAADNVGVNWN